MGKIYYCADFETLPLEFSKSKAGWKRKDLIYAWGLMDHQEKNYFYGTDLKSFIEKLENLPWKTSVSTEIYFHNGSKFDFHYIIKGLTNLGFQQKKFSPVKKEKIIMPSNYKMGNFIKKRKRWKAYEYKLFTDEQSIIYQITLSLPSKKEGKLKFVYFKCSNLLVDTSLEKIGKKVGLKKLKETVSFRKEPYKNKQELENDKLTFNYLKMDVLIIVRFLQATAKIINRNNLKLTIGATGYHNWKKVGQKEIENFYIKKFKKDWTEVWKSKTYKLYNHKLISWKPMSSIKHTEILLNRIYPVIWLWKKETQESLRQWFSGGLTTYHSEKYGKIQKNVFVVDINSSYPSIMSGDYLLPFGEPKKGDGGKNYPCKLYKIRSITKLKTEKWLPFIGIEKNLITFYPKIVPENYVFYLTSPEFLQFKIQYTGKYYSEIKWSFQGVKGKELFFNFIMKWQNHKIESSGNDEVLYLWSKLIQNAVYGKFATKVFRLNKIFNPIFNNGTNWEPELTQIESDYYLPVGIFITAYGRMNLVKFVGENYENGFIYADTDSVASTVKFWDDKKLDDKKLGFWKMEFENGTGVFVGKKRYILKNDKKTKLALASFHVENKNTVQFNDLIFGMKITQLQTKEVEFGKVLVNVEKELPSAWADNYQRADDVWFSTEKEFLAGTNWKK